MRNSSIITIRSMFALFVGMAFLFVGNGLIISSAGVELKKMGAGELETGFVIAVFFVGAMAATIFSHKIVSKVGHIRSFGIFASLFGIAAMFHDLSQNLYFWAFILFSSIPLNLIRIKEPPIPEKKSVSIPRVFALVPLALITSIVAGILTNGFFTMGSVYVLLQGYGAVEVSFFMTIAMAGGFIAHSFIGSVSDKFGRRPAIMVCSAVSLCAAICFLALKPSIYAQYVLSFFFGFRRFLPLRVIACSRQRRFKFKTEKSRHRSRARGAF